MMHIVDDWHKCYARGWGKNLVPEAFAHPAKVSFSLSEKIYKHVIAEGWVKPGAVVLDPFGGIAGFALHAMLNGLTWVGCELEPRFVALGNQNIEFWNKRYAGRMKQWGRATLLQGDSRNLRAVLGGAGAELVATSPPYAEADIGDLGNYKSPSRLPENIGDLFKASGGNRQNYGIAPGQLAALPPGRAPLLVTSPPYVETIQNGKSGIDWSKRKAGGVTKDSKIARHQDNIAEGYGITTGQISSLPEGDLQAALSVTSPPFAGVVQHDGGPAHQQGGELHSDYGHSPAQLANMPEGELTIAITSPPYSPEGVGHDAGHPRLDETEDERRAVEGSRRRPAYGISPAQLARLPEGAPLTVTSLPFEKSLMTTDEKFMKQVEQDKRNGSRLQPGLGLYGDAPGNIGNDSGETFWSAALAIVRETFAALCPGAHAVWVVKSYVRDGKLVDFPGQWRALCESIGFVTLHEHHALLSEEHGEQIDLDGNGHKRRKEKKSFFRRLAERKGAPPIDYETIFCMSRP